MTAPTPLAPAASDGPSIDEASIDVNDTFKQLPAAVRQKLAGFLKQRATWGAAGSKPPNHVPPGSCPNAVKGGCEFCPALGGGCIVCQEWD
jgi:hypothetical protein